MSGEIRRLEESLKEFLSGADGNTNNSRQANLYKYNNLKIFMEPKYNEKPHFIVRIGISEATYLILGNEKISGGLGSDERLIRRWADKPYVKADLNIAWANSQKAKKVTSNIDDEENY
jgi:hypothetical protein